MTLYTESVADQTDHFAVVFVRETVANGYDVVTFENTQPTPFCLEKSSGRKWTIECFSSVKLCKNNDHTCLFHCINTCRVPRMMLNTRPIGLVFKQHPRDPANVNA